MKHGRWKIAGFLWTVVFSLLLAACGDNSVTRYDPGVAVKPVGVSVTSGNGQVSISWTPTAKAAAYNIYYATSPGVTVATANRKQVTTSSYILPGLSNDLTYYFAVTAVNSSGESPLSDELAVVPSQPGPFLQSDLQGTWRFNALVSGAGAKWMRGTVGIDATGSVTVSSFLDSSGNTVAPSDLFTTMILLPNGTVLQSGAAAGFHGTLSANQFKDTLVGVAGTGAGSRLMAILQKQVAGVTFSSSDIKGTGKALAGPLSFVYHQLSSGANQEWEYAGGQVGQDQSATYLSIQAPTARQLPGAGNKATTFAIAADGMVTETAIAGILPQPLALLSRGVMSADKMTVVGTMTDSNGAFVLRVMQMVHPPSIVLSSTSYLPADLAGTYSMHSIRGGAAPLWAYGVFAVDPAGAGSFSSYLNSSGALTAPAPFALSLDQQGATGNAADLSYHGTLSYFKDLMVSTRTDAAGGSALEIALKR
jgi:hypothetical protein